VLIGICGLIGSGKDTVAQNLIDNHNFVKISFADKLKDAVASMFSWDRELLDGKTDKSRAWREQVDQYWTQETGREITPRLVLQEFGTECMREGFYDGIWVSLTKKHIIDNPNTHFVIPDVRFPNEAKMLYEVGGQVWRVKRGQDPIWFRIYQDVGVEPKDVHASEWAWAHTKFTHTIDNNGTLLDLKNQVQDHLVSSGNLLSA
jgi:hypothetical protein|tara:strand:+ start:22058 stop:22669 length:612 start_codon:yes stop_codon:yes gene_type:complete